ncbi:YraN family protein [Photorhabdus caribbeanensis]|uniref:YraN family protein n=1 Tax=Photorhabdus caribbeanensis TaxID=1004165 RepID=UPI001BD66C5A|nr:YraN family protein [Photorhabdus caribbeanensis]MBS9425908.1 YraN family protein [Photorhabdus caribbeanensis]
MKIKKLTSYLLGRNYETQAKLFLQKQGLSFIAANVKVRGGEIDLIMKDKQTWVFIEVRFRKSGQHGDALMTVTHSKCKKLLHAAAIWLLQRGECFETSSCRFDICAITGQQFDWLQNAFNQNEFTR